MGMVSIIMIGIVHQRGAIRHTKKTKHMGQEKMKQIKRCAYRDKTLGEKNISDLRQFCSETCTIS